MVFSECIKVVSPKPLGFLFLFIDNRIEEKFEIGLKPLKLHEKGKSVPLESVYW